METAAEVGAVPPPTDDAERSDRIVAVTPSTDPRKALADIAQQRAESQRRRAWKRTAQAALVLGMLAAALLMPRFREHGRAAAHASRPASGAAPAGSTLPAATASIAAVPSDAEPVIPAAPDMAVAPEDPYSRCEGHFKARSWRSAIESCSAAFDATPSPSVAMRVAHARWAHGDAAGAGTWARNALELESNDPDAYLLIGNAEHAAGKRQKAVAAYRQYLELAPRGWHAARLRAYMRTTPAAGTAAP